MNFDFESKIKELDELNIQSRYGRIKSIKGLQIISEGPDVSIGEICYIKSKEEEIPCEVIGFDEDKKTLMPFKPLFETKAGDKVYASPNALNLSIGEDYLGCVLNGIGEIIEDNNIPIKNTDIISPHNTAPKPTERGMIDLRFETGVRAIDGLLTLGIGQRIGLFAGSGVGKSTLVTKILKGSKADIKIICLVGERGRELNDFIEALGDERKTSIVVVATSNESALMKLKSAYTATRIAEYFRDTGKDVLLIMDSLTRFAMAQREIASNRGELAVNKGYPPSALSLLGELLERAGKSSKGSITGVYTVLVEGDDDDEIISDTVRGILDGHIFLSKKLVAKKHYPAIDTLKSVSRIMDNLITEEHKEAAANINSIISYCEEKEAYLNTMYKKGTNPNIDRILELNKIIRRFLQQKKDETSPMIQTEKFLVEQFKTINVDV